MNVFYIYALFGVFPEFKRFSIYVSVHYFTMPSNREIVERVENGLEYLWKGLSKTFTAEFSGLIERCMEMFYTLEWTQSGYEYIQMYTKKKMPGEEAMQVIKEDLLPLLRKASDIQPANASKEFRKEFHKLLEYIETEVDNKSPLIITPEALTPWQQEVILRLSNLEANVSSLQQAKPEATKTPTKSWFGGNSGDMHTLMRRMNELNADV